MGEEGKERGSMGLVRDQVTLLVFLSINFF